MTSRPLPTRLCLALTATIGLASVVGLSTGGPAQASYPGTNGTIVCGGILATEIADPVPMGQSRSEIFSVNPDGTGTTRLTQNTVSDVRGRYSADGTKIAWVRANQIWTMNADGSNQVGPLTSVGTSTFVGDWSPDGSQIVFQTSRDGNFEVYKMNADGSNQVNLTNNAEPQADNDTQPTWSPDGTKIAYQTNREGNANIHVMNADGTNSVNVTGSSPAEESAPRWSPDGTKIAFQSDRATAVTVFPRPGVGRNLEIYRINANGSDAKQLTFNDYDATAGSATTNLTGFDLNPAWSPDGTRIVFHSGRAAEFRDSGSPGFVGQWDVYTVDAVTGEGPGGTGLQRVTTRPGNDDTCDWQPIPRQTLTVNKVGGGTGTVVSTPAGIACGTDCTEEYAKGSTVTLTASAATGSRFDGFTGGGCGGVGTSCTVTMSEARTVSASFSTVPAVMPPVTPVPLPAGLTKLSIASRQPLLTARTRGIAVKLTCRARCTVSFALTVTSATARKLGLRSTKIGSRTLTLTTSGTRTVRVALTSAAKVRLRKATSVIARLKTTQTSPKPSKSSTKTILLKR